MMKGRSLSRAVLLGAVLAATVFAGTTAPRAGDTKVDKGAKVDQKVRDRIANQGQARVLVSLRLPSGANRPEGALPTIAAVVGQRQDIAAAQALVKSLLSGTGHHVIHSYGTVPLLALSIDAAALTRLEASGQVVGGIFEDALRAPTLPSSVPLVEGVDAWNVGFDGTGSVVAIVDTGVDKNHPFLAGKVIEEACYSSTVAGHSTSLCPNGQDQQIGAGAGVPCPNLSLACWHGTHVAGIAAGNGDQAGQTFSGVAKGAQIVAIQVFSLFNSTDCGGSSQCIMAWTSDIIAGLERVYALSSQYNISSANLSLGGGLYSSNCDDDPTKPIIDNLRAAGVATAVAAGNGSSVAGLSAPGCISSAVSVGSTTKTDVVSSFSNAASFMSLWAPGSSIMSSYPGAQYATASGTSMATPHVTGAFAVLRQVAPNASVTDILTALQQTGLPVTDTRTGGTVTKPRIRIFQALQALSPGSINFTLTLTKAGSGAGTVSSTPSGIDCGATCTAGYASGQQVTLQANAVSGSVFTGWSGACTGTGICAVTMTANKTVTATFSPTFALTVSKTGTGSGTVSSTPAGISCGSTCAASYVSGQQVTLQTSAPSGSVFTGWSGACTGTGTCTVTMTADKSVTATFDTAFTLTVSKGGTGSGTVSSTPSGISCGSTCTASYANGQQVTLQASAPSGSVFTGWSGACTGTGACTVTMSASTSVTATFSPAFTLTVSKGGSGSGTVSSTPAGISCGPTCSAKYASGQPVTLQASASSGSVFKGWSGACTGTGACTVTMTSNKSVTATFAPIVTLTVSKAGTGSGSVSSTPAGINCGSTCSASYTSGQQVTLQASAPSGSVFAGWSGACSGTGSCTVTMNGNKNVTATFNATFTLTVSTSGTGTGSVTSSPAGISCGSTCSASYQSGQKITLTASAGSGSRFTGWSGVCSGTAKCTVTMTGPQSVGAIFTPR